MPQEDIVALQLFSGILADNLLGLPLEVILGLMFLDVFMKAEDVVIQFVELLVELFVRASVDIAQFPYDDGVQHSQVP